MEKTRYEVMEPSHVTTPLGYRYPDVLSFPMRKFKMIDDPIEVEVTQMTKERFYMECYKLYGVPYYDDIVLWVNGVSTVHSLELGDKLYFPSKKDIDRFLVKHRTRKK